MSFFPSSTSDQFANGINYRDGVIFGAHHHRYRHGLILTPEEVSAFEQEHRIVLPEDYRSFLLSIENGGAGPYYGLFPLEGYHWELDDTTADFLAGTFPHREVWRPDPNVIDQEAADEEHAYFGNAWVQGAMRICQFGCGVSVLFIVSGPERGTIWMNDRVSDNGIVPWESDFLTWYEKWLDEGFKQLEQMARSARDE